MADANKMAAPLFVLLNAIVLANAHNEAPNNNNLVLSSDELDGVNDGAGTERDQSNRRKNPEWQYEGMPIELADRRSADNPVTTTKAEPPTTVKSYPPLNHRYRRIYDPDEKASVEDYPFMAAVLVNKELWCGAAIIDKDSVVTAAHCLQLQYNNRFFREYVKMLTVRVGSTNATAGGEVLRVVEIIFHPNYKPATLEFNVAVLKLHKNMTFGVDPPIRDIDYLKETVVPTDNNIKFLGWGSVLGGGGSGGSVLLQQVDLPVYDIADCQTIYGRELVSHTNFCAGYITQRKNVCNHDAGGPAIMGAYLVGVLSFSAKRCDNLDQPAVFTSIGAVAPWLDTLNEGRSKGLKVA